MEPKLAVEHPQGPETPQTTEVPQESSKPKRSFPWKKILKFLKKFWWLVLIGVIVLLIIIAVITPKTVAYEYSTTEVEKGNLIQTVEATGAVEPSAQIELRFPASGTLLENSVIVGQEVKEGDVLAKIDDRELGYRKNQAGASLNQAQANLNKILAGASAEDISISENSTEKSAIDYQNALNNLELVKAQSAQEILTYEESYNKATEDIKTYEQSLIDTTLSEEQKALNYQNSAISAMESALTDCTVALDYTMIIHNDSDLDRYLGIRNPQMISEESASYQTAQNNIATARTQVNSAKALLTTMNITTAANATLLALDSTFDNLSDMFAVLAGTATGQDFTNTELAAYKTSINTQIASISAEKTTTLAAQQNLANGLITNNTNINTAESNIVSAKNAANIAKANYDLAKSSKNSKIETAESQANAAKASLAISQAQLDYKKAPARSFDVSSYRAQVNQLGAAYQIAKKNWEDASIKAPIDGVVTKIAYEKGEQVSQSSAAIIMVNTSGYEIEVDISEADIAKIRLANKTEITLDAFGEDTVYKGNVTSIEPAETVIQDVIYYTVRISFDEIVEGIKPGMTANITINTAERNNVLFTPRRSVIDKNGKKIVRLLVDGEPQEVEVETGLRADNGLIEIREGLNEGENVITFSKEIK